MFSTGGGGFPSAPGLTGTRISLSGPGPSGAGPKSGEEVEVKVNEDSVIVEEGKTDKKSRRRKARGGVDLDPSDLTVPEVPQRPWYMQVNKPIFFLGGGSFIDISKCSLCTYACRH